MPRQIEQTLQEQFTFYLYSRGVLFCASAGGMRTSMATAIRMKKAGYKKGHPDVVIYEPRGGWHGMTCELKVSNHIDKNGDQRKWQRDLLKRGYYAIIVPGNCDFWDARKYLEDRVHRYLKGEIKRCHG